MATDIEQVEAYFAALPEDSRAMLQEIRETIRAAAPQAVEAMSYGMPAFKDRKPIVAYGAFKQHCSLFPMSVATIDALAEEIGPYRTSKGTLQFSLAEPAPRDLITKVVKARVAENEAKRRK
jgi:uncharacterized protein YdhG (YjbR/CyaY superfamily)